MVALIMDSLKTNDDATEPLSDITGGNSSDTFTFRAFSRCFCPKGLTINTSVTRNHMQLPQELLCGVLQYRRHKQQYSPFNV